MFSVVSYFSQALFYHPCMVRYFLLHVMHELSFYHKIKAMFIFTVHIHVYVIDKKETEQNWDSLNLHLLGVRCTKV